MVTPFPRFCLPRLPLGVLLATLLAFAVPVLGQAQKKDNVTARLVADRVAFQPNHEGRVAGRVGVLFAIQPGWHIYWRNSGEAAIPTKVNWSMPEGWNVGATQWPLPKRFIERGDIVTFGYSKEVLLFTDLFVVPDDSSGAGAGGDVAADRAVIKAEVEWLACSDICVPGSATLSGEFPYSVTAPLAPSSEYETFERFTALVPAPPINSEKLSVTSASLHRVNRAGEGEAEGVVLRVAVGNFPQASGCSAAAHEQAAAKEGVEKVCPEGLQFFPYEKQPLVMHGEPRIRRGEERGGIVLYLPVEVREGASSGQASAFRGVFALSGEKFGGQRASSLGEVGGAGGLKSAPSALSASSDRALLLEIPDIDTVIAKNPLTALPALEQEYDASKPLTFRVKRAGEGSAEGEEGTLDDDEAEENGGAFSLRVVLLAMLMGVMGGIVLNVMPCVLPVVSIKLMRLVEKRDASRREAVMSALAFSGGIIGTFLILGVIVAALHSSGSQVGWGFQFQSPTTIALLAVVVMIMSLGFFDLYVVQLPGVGEVVRFSDRVKTPLFKDVTDGVLATLLSTPCTAPFLGSALALAFTVGPLATVTVFCAIGVGLSLPYLLFVANPRLLSLVPRPGMWMSTVKEFLGFLLLATVLWLVWVLDTMVEGGAVWLLSVLLSLLFLLWWIRRAVLPVTLSLRGIFSLLTAAAIAYVFMSSLYSVGSLPFREDAALQKGEGREATANGDELWGIYSEEAVRAAHARGQGVFIEFTASWCITCKANERFVLSRDDVRAAFKEFNVQPLKADWTTGSQPVTEALTRFGGTGVPYYVFIPPGGEPVVLPTLISLSVMREAFGRGV